MIVLTGVKKITLFLTSKLQLNGDISQLTWEKTSED